MNDYLHPFARIGKEFIKFPRDERDAIESLAKETIRRHLAELGPDARYMTPRQVFDAVGPDLYRRTSVWPRYFFHKIVREFGVYLRNANGEPGAPHPFARILSLPFGPPPLAHTVDTATPQSINSNAIEPNPGKFNPNDDFTPFAALLAREQCNAVADFDSFSRDAHVWVFRLLINGSPQYGLRRTESDAEFFGSMRWRSSRATVPNKETYEGGSVLERPPEGNFREKRVVVHLRACTWHLEGNERLFDFPTLFQEAYGFSRSLAWLMARALIRAAYLADLTALNELAKLCTDSLTKRRGSDFSTDEKPMLLQTKAIWLRLCKSIV